MPGLGHGDKVELTKYCTRRKVAGQQRVGHLPEKGSGRVMTGHVVALYSAYGERYRTPPCLVVHWGIDRQRHRCIGSSDRRVAARVRTD